MKASEIVRVWNQNGASHNSYSWYPLYGKLQQDGDFDVDATPELMALSEECERQQKPFVFPHLTCNWALDNPPQLLHDWRYGHRPIWEVCARCKIVHPCPCYKADVDGRGDWMGPDDENGRCPRCGRPLGELLLACIRERQAFREMIERERESFQRDAEFRRESREIDGDASKIVICTHADLDLHMESEGPSDDC